MSRYVIPSVDPDRFCVVGYDPPLKVFFGQVYSKNKELNDKDEALIKWFMSEPSVEALASKMNKYMRWDDSIADQLVRDSEDASEPTPMQEFFAKMFHDTYNPDMDI